MKAQLLGQLGVFRHGVDGLVLAEPQAELHDHTRTPFDGTRVQFERAANRIRLVVELGTGFDRAIGLLAGIPGPILAGRWAVCINPVIQLGNWATGERETWVR